MPAESPEPLSTAKRFKRALCVFVCGYLGLLIGVIGVTRFADDDDLTSAYLVSTTCTIAGIVAGFCLARLEHHVRVWEIIVATILILVLCAFSVLGSGGRVR